MLREFSASEVGGRARGLLAVLILLLLSINGLNVLNSYVGRDFMTALAKREMPLFIRQALLYVGVFALSTLADVFLRFTEETLALTWREWMSRWAVSRYLRRPVYHQLSDRLISEGAVPNPDERIADDVRAFTATTISFLLLFLNGTFTFVAFSGVLWSIRPALFLVAVTYAAVGSLLAYVFGRALVTLNVTQLDQEANFRSELIHVRENAQPLAVARREDVLRGRLLGRIAAWVNNFRRIIRVNRNLGFFVTGYNYLIQIIPVLLVAPLFMRREVEFGVVTQSAMAFAQLVGAASLVITQFQQLSSYAAVVTRLGVLEEGIELAESRPLLADEGPAVEVGACGEKDALVYEDLTLRSPADGHVLLRDLRGRITPGMRLRIGGPNDEAKAALFRATAGTWAQGSGRLLKPGDDRILFLAERPYLPPGTLREVLTNPGQTLPEERVLAALRELDLDSVPARIGGLDVERRWDHLLTLSEQQRVAVAHVLLTAPCFVFLERPRTALGVEALSQILALLKARSISVLAIDNTDSDYYNSVLALDAGGAWQWNPRHMP
jgi:putative ATP-binding cassette transporter